MGISFTNKGNWNSTDKLLKRTYRDSIDIDLLHRYGKIGVQLLSEHTPKDTGKTAESWYYTIKNQNGKVSLVFNNSNVVDGVPIAIILQYGHATRTGGWVEGQDYINPALRPAFARLAFEAWKEAIW